MDKWSSVDFEEMGWTAFNDYVALGVDSLIVTILYAIYRRKDQIIKSIAVS